ncbi:ATP-dependent DNA helicase PIF1-like [Senna tora]|uniref:ATP-dependent DNA helicase n=1 Tax=Senna tora TaxID=362788 RepID=A0A834TSD4_9FABA|nr:ATP-dependent DNA helicase PIF1-like [Senna tora]
MNEDQPVVSTITNVQQHTLVYEFTRYLNIIFGQYNSKCGRGISGQIDPFIVCEITTMLDSCNALVQVFISVKDRVCTSPSESLKLRLVKERKTDGRTYNLPTSSKIVVLIVCDIDSLESTRDIVVEMQSGLLKRINELHPLYLALHILHYSTLCSFHMERMIKLDRLVDDLMNDKYFGRVIALIYTVEFHKRGLPHAHIIVFLHPYEDIRIVDGILYPTFKDACYSLGLLDNDREYIDGIIEANISEVSICNIKQGLDLAELLSETKLIIWDGALMANKYYFEVLDRTMCNVLRFSNPLSKDLPFEGKVVVFGGDFRQILPVIPKGSRQDIVNATLNSSHLWSHCKVLTLTKNMRLQVELSQEDLDEIKSFSNWILAFGNEIVGGDNDGYGEIEIPEDILIKEVADPISAIVVSTYPCFVENLNSIRYFQERAILCPTLEDVDVINDYMLSMLPGDEVSYFSFDSICVPNHVLKLKVGTPIMLLRNLDRSMSLCNGSRLICN